MKQKEIKEHQVLYQKYRPNQFLDVIGQNQFVNMLMQAIKTNQLANAYIFSGPHGIGKTTLARILAKAANCLNNETGDACNQCANCLAINKHETMDIVEIDAASNNGVDSIRNIIENASYLPANLKYKVYIIDEAHMITIGGWNAFLKTLENKNSHLIFIFATTEIQKIPKTILSRCQIYNLYTLTNQELLQLLNLIINQEKIKISDDAKLLICELANGSARDMLSIVEQLISSHNIIDKHLIENVFSLANKEQQFILLKNILEANYHIALRQLNDLYDKGINIYQLINNLLDLSVEYFIFKKVNDDKLIKPSNYLLFKNQDIDILMCTSFIEELEPLISDFRKKDNTYILFRAFVIRFMNKIKKDSGFINNKNNDDNQFDSTNNEETSNSDYLSSFIINNKQEKQSDHDVFIINAKARISMLDESWKNEKLPNISLISSTNDVTNNLIKKLDVDNEEKSKIKTDSVIDNVIDKTLYFSFATYNVNEDENTKLLKKYNLILKNILETNEHEFLLLKEGLKLVDKLILVNKYFMIIKANNLINAKKFNELASQNEMLKEIFNLFNHEFYIYAYTSNEIKQIYKNPIKFDENKYNEYVSELKKIDSKEDDIENWTNKMIFKEK